MARTCIDALEPIIGFARQKRKARLTPAFPLFAGYLLRPVTLAKVPVRIAHGVRYHIALANQLLHQDRVGKTL